MRSSPPSPACYRRYRSGTIIKIKVLILVIVCFLLNRNHLSNPLPSIISGEDDDQLPVRADHVKAARMNGSRSAVGEGGTAIHIAGFASDCLDLADANGRSGYQRREYNMTMTLIITTRSRRCSRGPANQSERGQRSSGRKRSPSTSLGQVDPPRRNARPPKYLANQASFQSVPLQPDRDGAPG